MAAGLPLSARDSLDVHRQLAAFTLAWRLTIEFEQGHSFTGSPYQQQGQGFMAPIMTKGSQ